MSPAQPLLPAMLHALSGELAQLHGEALTLQEVLPVAPEGSPAVLGLQRLDALTQTLEALAAYTVGMAEQLAAGGGVDPARAAEAVPLAALALRLALKDVASPLATAGELDLF